MRMALFSVTASTLLWKPVVMVAAGRTNVHLPFPIRRRRARPFRLETGLPPACIVFTAQPKADLKKSPYLLHL
jgi:hypothetical protein